MTGASTPTPAGPAARKSPATTQHEAGLRLIPHQWRPTPRRTGSPGLRPQPVRPCRRTPGGPGPPGRALPRPPGRAARCVPGVAFAPDLAYLFQFASVSVPRPAGVSDIARVNRKEFTAKLKPEEIDYKRLDVLSRFLTPIGKIEPARRTGASRTQQTRIVRAIKRARYLGLLPYTINDTR
ncbi:MAG: 30S ribosomal protein S18 [Gemmatimonadaceae bacterium]|nr:30S ribosomal protein S18 [Gemmatimonadaceae bacterium]